MVANAWHPKGVPVDAVISAIAANSTWTSVPVICIDVIRHPRASTCPAGITVGANLATLAPCTTVPRARNASTSTSATNKRRESRGGTRVILLRNASTPKVAMSACARRRRTWKSPGKNADSVSSLVASNQDLSLRVLLRIAPRIQKKLLHCHAIILGCLFEDREVNNGETLAPSGNPCRRCICQDGVITCKDPVCDCSAPGSRRDKCCPQCNPTASCRHQELHNLVFRSGERWIYQCQTCECLVINLSELQYTSVRKHDGLVKIEIE